MLVSLPDLQAQTRFRAAPQSIVEPPSTDDKTCIGHNPACKVNKARLQKIEAVCAVEVYGFTVVLFGYIAVRESRV